MTGETGGSNFYADKVILAPMVRACRCPLRLLALEHGADLVYTEEIIDQKLLSAKRTENEFLGTIDYSLEDEIILRVCSAREGDRCVLQIGTNSAERAAELAKKVGKDVAAIDVNMGCPKTFSLSGGMGAALLHKPYQVKEILTSLSSVSAVPVSCKIRLMDKLEDSLELVQMIERCGVAAVGVHGRRIDERQQHTNRTDEIREIVRAISIPVIANGYSGEIHRHEDISRFRELCGASSIMIARKALTNPSIFRRTGGLWSMEDEIKRFLSLACEYDESFTMTKYVIQRILGSQQEFDSRGRATVLAASCSDLCKAWSLDSIYDGSKKRLIENRKRKTEHDPETGIQYIDITFPMKRLKDRCGADTPKCVLNRMCDEGGIPRPLYECKFRPIDGRYEAIIDVLGKKFSSRMGQPNKKMAEQVAALAALIGLGRREKLLGNWEE
ncbi:hypothetical protein AB6A40_005733 [Gnathostoma spinigerum]|uniref:DRBM domain-containing protein n=1 Tax=Gnathostoma spinigerum TaxID=75299 RepID=A0ABD6ENY9_9BILA